MSVLLSRRAALTHDGSKIEPQSRSRASEASVAASTLPLPKAEAKPLQLEPRSNHRTHPSIYSSQQRQDRTGVKTKESVKAVENDIMKEGISTEGAHERKGVEEEVTARCCSCHCHEEDIGEGWAKVSLASEKDAEVKGGVSEV